ncbi:TPA: metal ABC transporter permease [Candidatus Dependentiae bacterium]|nr:MAG: Multidrug resistance protein Atm1 [candidate division TM6 bacterium GW2011_GWF2_36_131]KKQ02554.1 MAG: Multidrug resistance protein Atm1 [candidate division TM6 bacterium GW2011_GWE2_36_25]KKQ19309.1 MAG: Multidrug resistance protein Atm1 [candidate division TM6 bacterium GW2011_GWA2_36_9]HBR70918.1 metal ABC transporter permease [Candidatus Dependentiae bacterium]HCU00434.1 metal ABC transporter permease [Candidatus Dependentiae bacterium]
MYNIVHCIKNFLTIKFMPLKTLFQLRTFFWTNNRSIQIRTILSLLFTLLMIGLNVTTPLVFKYLIQLFSHLQTASSFLIYLALIIYGGLWTCNQLISNLRSILLFRSLERGSHLLSVCLLNHFHELSLRFHLERQTGALTSMIERAQFGFESIFWGIILFILPTIIEMVTVLLVLTYLYGIFYSGILLLIMATYLSFSFLALDYSEKKQTVYNKKRSGASGRIIDSIFNFETVKYFNNEIYENEQCNNILQEQENAGTDKHIADTIVQLGQGLIIGLGLLIITFISGSAVIHKTMDISDFILINGYLLQFVMPLQHFGYVVRHVRKGLNDMQEALDLLTLQSEVQDKQNAINIITTQPSITFDNVSFGYEKRRIILKNISFTIPHGKTMAIVGPTGSGKSTLAKLLFRFYDVNEGCILVNDLDIRNITQSSLHKIIGVVPQDTVLFNNTLYYNVAYGQPEKSHQEIEHVVKLAHLDTFIKKLPDGYQTKVGERGLKLSGGEKQRVAIARTLLKNPSIFIFDEATSSLDTHTEQEIQKNIEEISTNATTLIIAHRLSTIVHADEIIVLDKGSIVERGTHQSLLKNNGLYRMLWEKQSLKH